MTATDCKTLKEHYDRDRSNGLLDVKFYIHQGRVATPAKLCVEALRLEDAVQSGNSRRVQFTGEGICAA